jgi:hypothetical protein
MLRLVNQYVMDLVCDEVLAAATCVATVEEDKPILEVAGIARTIAEQ